MTHLRWVPRAPGTHRDDGCGAATNGVSTPRTPPGTHPSGWVTPPCIWTFLSSLGKNQFFNILLVRAPLPAVGHAVPLGEEAAKTRQVYEVEREFLPREEAQGRTADGGDHILRVSQIHFGLRDHAEGQMHHRAELSHAAVLFFEIFTSNHASSPECFGIYQTKQGFPRRRGE